MATERVKPIIIRDAETNEEYTLEFNRETIMFAEGRKFDIDDVGRFPMSKIPELLRSSLRSLAVLKVFRTDLPQGLANCTTHRSPLPLMEIK